MNFQKQLLIYWIVAAAVSITLSFIFNALIGLAASVASLVIMLFWIRKKNQAGGLGWSYFDQSTMGTVVKYLCLRCSSINKSSDCPKCGGKIAKPYF